MASAAWSARSQAPARGFMAEYQFIVDDGRSVDLGIETVDAMDNEEAELLARMRWASSPMVQKIIVMKRSLQIVVIDKTI